MKPRPHAPTIALALAAGALALSAGGCRLALSDHGDVDPQTTRWLDSVERGIITAPPAVAPTARGGGPSSPTSARSPSVDRAAAEGWPRSILWSGPLSSARGGGPVDAVATDTAQSTATTGDADSASNAGETRQADSTAAPAAAATAQAAATPATAAPSGPTMESRSFSSNREPPIHGDPFSVVLGESNADVTPPTHAQAQPMVLALESACGRTSDPECEPASTESSPFGWLVCVHERASCSGADPTDVAAEAVRRTDAAAAGGVLHRGGVVVAHGDDARWVASVRTAEPTRWPYVLLIDARPDNHGTDDIYSRQLPSRVAFLEPRMPASGSPTLRLEEQLREHGVTTAWFLARPGSSARDGAVRRSLAWLFAGSDSDLCARHAHSSAAREGSAPTMCDSATP